MNPLQVTELSEADVSGCQEGDGGGFSQRAEYGEAEVGIHAQAICSMTASSAFSTGRHFLTANVSMSGSTFSSALAIKLSANRSTTINDRLA